MWKSIFGIDDYKIKNTDQALKNAKDALHPAVSIIQLQFNLNI